jgi:hypothetical protein
VGSALFQAAETWARTQGCLQLKVETQTINLPACRFYGRHGCVLKAAHPDAYPALPQEIQLLWYKDLESTARAPRTPLMLTAADEQFFAQEQARHEGTYLAGTNPRRQSGFDAHDWERFRRVVVAPIETDVSFLDIGCANGLLMESVVAWARED